MKLTPLHRVVVILTPLAIGCSDTVGFADREFQDAWQQSPTDAADVLFVVDNSASMADEQDLLASGFTSFVSALESTGTNFHLGVITTDFAADNPTRGHLVGTPSVLTPDDDYVSRFEERVHVGIQGSGKEQGLASAAYALSTVISTGPNAGFLRADSNLLVVVVSDEDDCSDGGRLGASPDGSACYEHAELLSPVPNYVATLRSLKADVGQVKIAGIVGPKDGSTACKDQTVPGKRYAEAAKLTDGLTSSICDADWSASLLALGLTAAGIETTFPLSYRASEGTLVVLVGDSEVPESALDGYTYDAEAHTITFHGLWVPDRGADISAFYTIEAGF